MASKHQPLAPVDSTQNFLILTCNKPCTQNFLILTCSKPCTYGRLIMMTRNEVSCTVAT